MLTILLSLLGLSWGQEPTYTQQQLQDIAEAYMTAPEPAIALALSSVVGFGSGAFYAHDKAYGSFYLITESAIIAATSQRWYAQEVTTTTQINSDEQITTLLMGMTTFAVLRLSETIVTPILAKRNRNIAIKQAMKVDE